jgi:hypothetical protein
MDINYILECCRNVPVTVIVGVEAVRSADQVGVLDHGLGFGDEDIVRRGGVSDDVVQSQWERRAAF